MNDLKFTTAGNYMDSKLDDLMYHAGLTADGCWDQMDKYDQQAIMRFARLIVRECIGIVHGSDMPVKDIKEHFGIE